jgi:hypothetical protein
MARRRALPGAGADAPHSKVSSAGPALGHRDHAVAAAFEEAGAYRGRERPGWIDAQGFRPAEAILAEVVQRAQELADEARRGAR